MRHQNKFIIYRIPLQLRLKDCDYKPHNLRSALPNSITIPKEVPNKIASRKIFYNSASL